MNQTLVDRIVNAVLYEGYVLYPYRPSVKSRQRWTFGGLFPSSYSEAQGNGEPWRNQTECLVRGGPNTLVQVQVRFLHLVDRLVGELDCPGTALREGTDPPFRIVESLQVGERLLCTWQEAMEREFTLRELDLGSLVAAARSGEFAFPAFRQLEPVRGTEGIVAVLLREQQAVAGVVKVSATPVAEELFKVGVRIENTTPLEDAGQRTRDDALLRSLVSTHVILGVQAGEFVSLLDPPDECRAIAAECKNVGTWPVLVGEAAEKDTMLSSPIILYDYPQIAPESPGDLFDGTEIDEILTLRILTLTDAEKKAAAAVDERVRALLQRSESLDRDQLRGLHGAFRTLRPLPEEVCHD